MSRPVYSGLGVETVLNAATTLTALGGSRMPEVVLHAMRDAADSFVDMHELNIAAGRKLAELTGNEAGYVTSGCAAGIVLAVLAARNHGDPSILRSIHGSEGVPNEVIIHAAHRIPYDHVVNLAGGRLEQIGNVQQTFDWELEARITPNTAAVLYVAGSHLPQAAIPLERVVEIARDKNVPVIVDAAAQLPPVENLWKFTQDYGADLVLFSGGKALAGPQASGLMLGRADLVEAARQNGPPFQRWGRAFKAGKEEIAGLLAAVDRFVNLDHAEMHAGWLRTVERWFARFQSIPGVNLRVEMLNEAGQPVPRLYISKEPLSGNTSALDRLAGAKPRVVVLPEIVDGVVSGFWISPDLLRGPEVDIVEEAVAAALTGN